ADVAPHLVGLDHDLGRLCWGRGFSGPGSHGVSSRYTALTKVWTHDRDRPVARAMARTPIRSRSNRRTRSFSASKTNGRLGAGTNRRPHPRQRSWGDPDRSRPLRTTWVAWHRGHGGRGVASCIPSSYEYPRVWATTRYCQSVHSEAACGSAPPQLS